MSFDRKTTASVATASEEGFTFEPKFPGGQGIGATITVCGPESRAARAQTRAQLKRLQALELDAKKQGQPADHLSLVLAQDPEEAPRLKADTAAAYTIDWKGFTDDGAVLAPTADNVRAVYLEHPWIADQVIEQAQALGNFVRPASRPSLPTPQLNSAST